MNPIDYLRNTESSNDQADKTASDFADLSRASISEAKNKVEAELAQGVNTSVLDLVNALIDHARSANASDIHIDPRQDELLVRFRIDGVMQAVHHFPKTLAPEIVSRIKILAQLRTDEHQAAQDGRFRIGTNLDDALDVRVSIIPTYHGENAVLRLLANQIDKFTLDSLGLSSRDKMELLKAIHRPHGMILVTGPTGSGKTTTLYALVRLLNSPGVSIVTIEDPIEYSINGVEQIQANSRTELTFANGLRSILRQDPNIIMVGEIRDGETAGIAVNTALTGHLLLSTLHTNDAATSLPRLLDMKIESYLIASTVNAVVGQRLVRKICSECKVEKKITDIEMMNLAEIIPKVKSKTKENFFVGKGCDACANTGFKGRIGVYEVMVLNAEMREAVLRREPASELRKLAIEHGMTTMLQDGYAKVEQGLTTLEEILRMRYE